MQPRRLRVDQGSSSTGLDHNAAYGDGGKRTVRSKKIHSSWTPYKIALDNGSVIHSRCGIAARRTGESALAEGGDIVTPFEFCWLPRRVQCEICLRTGLYLVINGVPNGQRSAPDDHAICIEVALLGIARVWNG
jgi:hypothetical protein